jgi:hypothetical protein
MGRVVYFNLEKFYNQTNQNGKNSKKCGDGKIRKNTKITDII